MAKDVVGGIKAVGRGIGKLFGRGRKKDASGPSLNNRPGSAAPSYKGVERATLQQKPLEHRGLGAPGANVEAHKPAAIANRPSMAGSGSGSARRAPVPSVSTSETFRVYPRDEAMANIHNSKLAPMKPVASHRTTGGASGRWGARKKSSLKASIGRALTGRR
jgi:hypothetical protein